MLVDLGPFGQQHPAAAFLVAVGSLFITTQLFKTARFIASTFIVPGQPLSSFGPKGSWAVITGASDGIGKEFALQIAAKGFNLILASRTQSKLDALSQQITSKWASVKVETLPIDFSSPSEQDYNRLEDVCKNKQIAILINNVGASHSMPVTFAETEIQEMQNIININCTATLRVTHLILPHMTSYKRGLILTMGSFGGLIPSPLLATYSGSKAFLQQWSNALASELEGSGITVHFIHAYLITSAMSKVRRSSWTIPSEKGFVRATLSKIGNQCGSVGYPYSGSPWWSHAIAAFGMCTTFGPMHNLFMTVTKNLHVSIRKRALKKAARNAQQSKKVT